MYYNALYVANRKSLDAFCNVGAAACKQENIGSTHTTSYVVTQAACLHVTSLQSDKTARSRLTRTRLLQNIKLSKVRSRQVNRCSHRYVAAFLDAMCCMIFPEPPSRSTVRWQTAQRASSTKITLRKCATPVFDA